MYIIHCLSKNSYLLKFESYIPLSIQIIKEVEAFVADNQINHEAVMNIEDVIVIRARKTRGGSAW